MEPVRDTTIPRKPGQHLGICSGSSLCGPHTEHPGVPALKWGPVLPPTQPQARPCVSHLSGLHFPKLKPSEGFQRSLPTQSHLLLWTQMGPSCQAVRCSVLLSHLMWPAQKSPPGATTPIHSAPSRPPLGPAWSVGGGFRPCPSAARASGWHQAPLLLARSATLLASSPASMRLCSPGLCRYVPGVFSRVSCSGPSRMQECGL